MPTSPSPPPADRLTRLDRVGLGLMAIGLLVFGGLIVKRSTAEGDRKTDFGVYARAGYAVRIGNDLYAPSTCDDHYWHYCYPVPFAILMVPLADPYQYEYGPTHGPLIERVGGGWYLRFGISVGIWYLLSLGFLAFAIDRFISAALPDLPRWSRRWWYARLIPLYVTLGGWGYTLARGQVNILLLAFLGGQFLMAVRGRPIASGLWLAASTALKVIPAYLALFPFIRMFHPDTRRDWQTSLGFVLGMAILLGVLPTLIWGIDGAIAVNQAVVQDVLAPGAAARGDQTRARELTNITATDNQSFQAALHNWRYPNVDDRPAVADRDIRLFHWVIALGMTTITVIVGIRRRQPSPPEQLTLYGCLVVAMMLASPVSHMHYYALALPLVAGLLCQDLARHPERLIPGPRTMTILALWGIAIIIALLPYHVTTELREKGFAAGMTILLWLVGLITRPGPAPHYSPND